MEICEMCLKNGEPVTKDYLCTFIDLINGIDDTELMLSTMHFLNALIRTQWSASMHPLAYLCFPVMSYHAHASHAQISHALDPWCRFQWPSSNVNGRLAFVTWLRIPERPTPSPILAFGLGNDSISMDIFLHHRSMVVSVNALNENKKTCSGSPEGIAGIVSWLGTATFEELIPLASWCQLAINFVFIMESEVLQMEVYRDGEWVQREAITLKSANLTSDSVKDFPTRFDLGSVRTKDTNEMSMSWNYAQSWIFSRKLSHVELLWLYLLGPSNTSLRDVKHARYAPQIIRTNRLNLT